MLRLSQKLKKSKSTVLIEFEVDSDQISKDFISKFGKKKDQNLTESEKLKLEEEAYSQLKDLKKNKILFYDFRNLNNHSFGYSHLASLIAGHCYLEVKKSKFLTKSLSSHSIYQESTTLPESDFLNSIKSRPRLSSTRLDRSPSGLADFKEEISGH